MPMNRRDDDGSEAGLGGKNIALANVGIVFAVSVAIGVLAGNWLDHRYGTDPWLTIVGLLVGSAAGFLELWKVVQEASD